MNADFRLFLYFLARSFCQDKILGHILYLENSVVHNTDVMERNLPHGIYRLKMDKNVLGTQPTPIDGIYTCIMWICYVRRDIVGETDDDRQLTIAHSARLPVASPATAQR